MISFIAIGSVYAAGILAMSEALKAIGFMLLPPAAGWLLDASNHTYRYTFLIGATVSLFAVLSLFIVYRKFKKISFSSNGGIDM